VYIHKPKQRICEPEAAVPLQLCPVLVIRQVRVVSSLLASNREKEFAICNEIGSLTVRRNLIILKKIPTNSNNHVEC